MSDPIKAPEGAVVCDICGDTGITPGWTPSYNDPSNDGGHPEAEPCDCKIGRERFPERFKEFSIALLNPEATWNAQADEFNQWDTLSDAEKQEWINAPASGSLAGEGDYPPESQWSEKPDAGFGMVWERADYADAGDKIIFLSMDGGWRGPHIKKHSCDWVRKIVFRAVPGPPSDALQKGGVEARRVWVAISHVNGCAVTVSDEDHSHHVWPGATWTEFVDAKSFAAQHALIGRLYEALKGVTEMAVTYADESYDEGKSAYPSGNIDEIIAAIAAMSAAEPVVGRGR